MSTLTKTTQKKAISSGAIFKKQVNKKSLPKQSSPAQEILNLHQTVGNQGVQRLFESGFIQGKLTVGEPNDKYEQEADRVADEVMRMPEPHVQRQNEEDEEEEMLQTKPIGEQITPLVQRQVEPEEEEEELIQEKSEGPIPDVTPNLESKINALQGGGQPLSKETRNFFEPRFGQEKENNTGLPDNLKNGIENLSGHSMDDVKVHYNSSQPAQLNAFAFAKGSDIHLASGVEQHLPHEAWHVVQQKQGRVQPTKQLKGKVNINDDEGLEREADLMGERALQMKSNNTLSSNPIQRRVNKEIVQLNNNPNRIQVNVDKLVSDQILEYFDKYANLQVTILYKENEQIKRRKITVRTPYYMNKTQKPRYEIALENRGVIKGGRTGIYRYAKGSPDEIQKTLQKAIDNGSITTRRRQRKKSEVASYSSLASSSHRNNQYYYSNTNPTSNDLYNWAKDVGLGVDCSGLVHNILNSITGENRKKIGGLTVGAKVITGSNRRNNLITNRGTPVSLQDLSSGDMMRTPGHIRLVMKVLSRDDTIILFETVESTTTNKDSGAMRKIRGRVLRRGNIFLNLTIYEARGNSQRRRKEAITIENGYETNRRYKISNVQENDTFVRFEFKNGSNQKCIGINFKNNINGAFIKQNESFYRFPALVEHKTILKLKLMALYLFRGAIRVARGFYRDWDGK